MATTKLMTAVDLWRLGEDARYELVEGALQEMSPVGGQHAEVLVEFARHLGNYVADHRLGKVFGGDAGIVFARNPDTLLAPDIAFIRAERLPPKSQRLRFLEVVPDLVVEIVSPSESDPAVAAKVAEYLRFGVRLVWVANPRLRTVTTYAFGREPRVLRETDELDGEDVLPGFRLLVAKLFE